MKTIQQIDHLIRESSNELELMAGAKKTAITKVSKRIQFLRQVKMYLETNPNPEFIKKMQSQAADAIKKIDSGFDEWKRFNPDLVSEMENPKARYYAETGMRKYKAQKKTLDFILA